MEVYAMRGSVLEPRTLRSLGGGVISKWKKKQDANEMLKEKEKVFGF